MESGYLSIVLHAHLPFVRRPDIADFLEERWLFEALSESYLPLLRSMRRMEEEGIPFRLTLSLSPTLQAMLADALLQERYLRWLERQLTFAGKEAERLSADPRRQALALMYAELYMADREDFEALYGRNILKGFDFFQKKGRLELITTAGTHAFLPLYSDHPESVAAQIETAIISHRKNFGRNPSGFWLPHLAWYPKLERLLKGYGLSWAVLSSRSVMMAEPAPFNATFAPVRCHNGLACFPRDLESAKAVLGPESGYPADGAYRDFYRDVGYELPEAELEGFMPAPDVRVPTGFKYCAIATEGEAKRIYDRALAAKAVREHAANFVYTKRFQMEKACELMDRPPIVLAAYDMEFLGHWWFEGIDWLEAVFRELAATEGAPALVSPSDYLSAHPDLQVVQPEYASAAEGSFAGPWMERGNAWLNTHFHEAADRLVDLAERFPNESGLKERALNQAAREVLLMQCSDWPYLMRSNPGPSFPRSQAEGAVEAFTRIYDMLSCNAIDTEWLTKLEKRNNLFPYINYRMWRRKR